MTGAFGSEADEAAIREGQRRQATVGNVHEAVAQAASGERHMTSIGNRIVPSLLVRDLPVTLAFYERLGFRLTGCDGERGAVGWAEVTRDGIVLRFHTEAPHGTPPSPVFSGTLYLYPASVDQLAGEWAAAGITFAWGPEVMDYGMKEFALQDPDGYYLAFTEPVPPLSPGE